MTERFPEARFGSAESDLPNWRNEPDEDDDEEPSETPPDVVAMLGFDPATFEESNGQRADLTGDAEMTEEEKKAAADKARKDAEEKEKAEKEKADREKADAAIPDKLLKFMDAMTSKMDSVCSRMDALEGKKGGAEETAADRKKDADEKEKAEKEAADKARKDGDTTAPGVTAATSVPDTNRKADGEKSEEEKKMDAARADSAALLDRVTRLESSITLPPTHQDYAAMAECQARADAVFGAFNKQAPPPMAGETRLAYRRRLLSNLKIHSERWSKVDINAIADEATLGIAEDHIFADAQYAAAHPKDLAEGELRKVERRNPATGGVIIEWLGTKSFIHGMKPVASMRRLNPTPGRRA